MAHKDRVKNRNIGLCAIIILTWLNHVEPYPYLIFDMLREHGKIKSLMTPTYWKIYWEHLPDSMSGWVACYLHHFSRSFGSFHFPKAPNPWKILLTGAKTGGVEAGCYPGGSRRTVPKLRETVDLWDSKFSDFPSKAPSLALAAAGRIGSSKSYWSGDVFGKACVSWKANVDR